MRPRYRTGFSIIELLVAMAIIGILAALLTPAIQYSRAAARETQCKNNLRQLGVACQSHIEQRGHFPSGGWGWRWAGDPDRGFSKSQPGGWLFNLLPFIELDTLHVLGKGGKNQTEGRTRASRSVPTFCCPSRRDPIPYPYTHSMAYFNIDRPDSTGRSDYAACGGDMYLADSWEGPATLSVGESMPEAEWATHDPSPANGVIFRRSMVKPAHITDGLTTTYLLGEKFLSPSYYTNSANWGDDQGWDVGYDWDTVRWTCRAPMQDTVGANYYRMFGSAHASQFHMVFCDGSVSAINYSIDDEVHRRLGTRNGGETVDQASY